jgi:hypothetical protein
MCHSANSGPDARLLADFSAPPGDLGVSIENRLNGYGDRITGASVRVTTGGDDTYGSGDDADTVQLVSMSTAAATETFEYTLPTVASNAAIDGDNAGYPLWQSSNRKDEIFRQIRTTNHSDTSRATSGANPSQWTNTYVRNPALDPNISPPHVCHHNLINNGHFNSVGAQVNSWRTNSSDTFLEKGNETSVPATPETNPEQSDRSFSSLEGTSNNSLYQDILTVPGRTYTLSFDYSGSYNGDWVHPLMVQAGNESRVYSTHYNMNNARSEPVHTNAVNNGGSGNADTAYTWTRATMPFTATAPLTRVTFNKMGSTNLDQLSPDHKLIIAQIFLDNVQVC